MSHSVGHQVGNRVGQRRSRGLALRRAVTLALALVALALVAGGGALLRPEQASAPNERSALAGRTTSICTVLAPQTAGAPAITSVSAVATQADPGRTGTVTGTPLGTSAPALTVATAGKGATVEQVKSTVVLQGDGGLAGGATGVVSASGTTGADTGLAAAPCVPPGTSLWFSGVSATDADRTELVLSNPDDAQAEVDLRFYGPQGPVAVPGSPGLIVEAHSSRTLSLTSVLQESGPLGVAIQASAGRVSAVALRTRTDALKPAGVDWQLPSVTPATTVTIPAVPEDEGSRQLVVTNASTARASVSVQVLGLQGPYAPAGAETLDLAPESSGSVDLTAGLAGGGGSVRLTSDQPVTGAVISSSQRSGATRDLAVQTATAPLVGTGVSALATSTGTDSEMILSNPGPTDTPVKFALYSYDGVSLRTDDVLLSAGSTATRRLTSQAPSYLVVTVPAGSSVVGGVVLTQAEGSVAGLATVPLTSPDLAGRVPRTVPDPSVGR